jgi:hypothetical protein
VDSGTEVPDAGILALLDWLKPEKDKETDAYVPDPLACKEAQRCVTKRMAELGQETLFPES